MSEKYYIGIMSGTSMDAIDCIVVNVKTNSIATIASKSFPYPPTIKRQIQQIYQHNYQLSLENFRVPRFSPWKTLCAMCQ